jgi:cytochrome c553
MIFCRAGGLPLQYRCASAALVVGRVERLRSVARPDGGPEHCELRFSDRASPRHTGYGGSGDQYRSAVKRGERIASLPNPWFTASVGITAAIAIVAVIAGFAWLPLQQQGERFRGVWDAICSAAGLVWTAPSGGQIVRADYPTTRVEIVPQMLQGASAGSIGRGATLALRCTMCHGARGLSQADSPNLAGQRDLQAARRLQNRRACQRSHGPARGRSQ